MVLISNSRLFIYRGNIAIFLLYAFLLSKKHIILTYNKQILHMQLILPIQIATIRKTSTTNGILFVFTMLINLLTHQNHPKPFRKINVPDQNSLIKQRSNFFQKKASNSTTDFCYQKSHFRMLLCKTDKILYIRIDFIHTAMHRRHSIRLPL